MIYNHKVTALVPIWSDTEMLNGHLRLFNNKPLYKTLISKLENIFAIDEIIVDTDIFEIEEELLSLFKKVIYVKRPDFLLKADTDINEIIRFDLDQTENNEIFIQTHINKPLLKKETIANALKKFVELEDNYDSLFAVNTYKSRFYNHENKPLNHTLKDTASTKILNPVYEENSCFYVFTRESFLKRNHRIGQKPFLYNTSNIESLELKDSLSYKLAEMLMLYQEL